MIISGEKTKLASPRCPERRGDVLNIIINTIILIGTCEREFVKERIEILFSLIPALYTDPQENYYHFEIGDCSH